VVRAGARWARARESRAGVNTAADFGNASLKIVLDGSPLHPGENGLTGTAGSTAVRGPGH
jgi:hypothetical protein